MGSLTSWTSGKNLLKTIHQCDIVEFNRLTYSHFGLYIGHGICVHVQAPDESSLGSSNRFGSDHSNGKLGTKVAERLVDIAGIDFVRVNNSELMAFQLGVNVRPKMQTIELAIKDLAVDSNADIILGKSIPVCYSLLSKNCEVSCTYWKYDHPTGWSSQVNNGIIHSTIGTVERFTDVVISITEGILEDDQESVSKKTAALAIALPYAAAKYSVKTIKIASDLVVGGLMRMFK